MNTEFFRNFFRVLNLNRFQVTVVVEIVVIYFKSFLKWIIFEKIFKKDSKYSILNIKY